MVAGGSGSGLPRAIGVVGLARAISNGWLKQTSRAASPVGLIPSRLTGSWQYPPLGQRVAAGRPQPGAFEDVIRKAARREGVDEQLVKAVVAAESGFNPQAVSSAGAKGLMQLMDGTARSLGVKDPFDPASNVVGGTTFLRAMLDRFGSVPLALAAYNAGPGAVEKYGGIPPYQETRNYVDRVLALQRRNRAGALEGPREVSGDGRRTTA